jgi:hypothetical protein
MYEDAGALDKDWAELTDEERAAAEELGYSEETFEETAPPVFCRFDQLEPRQSELALQIGWDEELWNNELEKAGPQALGWQLDSESRQNSAAVRIQAAHRGRMARKRLRAAKSSRTFEDGTTMVQAGSAAAKTAAVYGVGRAEVFNRCPPPPPPALHPAVPSSWARGSAADAEAVPHRRSRLMIYEMVEKLDATST